MPSIYYSIDSADGNELCSGLSERQVAGAAQRHADSTGDVVRVYASDGSDEWEVEPSAADAAAERSNGY
jgi:hypothetical protein